MAGHGFNFVGGEELSKMGATQFVSYSFYVYIDTSHINWENISTRDTRINVFNRTKNYHNFWLQQVLDMDDERLNTNKIGLNAKDTKKMARNLLDQLGNASMPGTP